MDTKVDRNAVRESVEQAISSARGTVERSAKTRAIVSRTLASKRGASDQRQRSVESVLDKLRSILRQEAARERTIRRTIMVRRLLLNINILYFRYRWAAIKLLAFATVVFLIDQYWDQVVEIVRIFAHWLREKIEWDPPISPAGIGLKGVEKP